MKKIFLGIFLAALWFIYQARPSCQPLPEQLPAKAPDEAIVAQQTDQVRVFLAYYHSPLEKYSRVFVEEAREHNLPVWLLPAVSCVESSCGKNYHLNPLGWGSDRIDFGTDDQDIAGIAEKIATLRYYREFRQTGDAMSFARVYNPANKDNYYGKLLWFKARFDKGNEI